MLAQPPAPSLGEGKHQAALHALHLQRSRHSKRGCQSRGCGGISSCTACMADIQYLQRSGHNKQGCDMQVRERYGSRHCMHCLPPQIPAVCEKSSRICPSYPRGNGVVHVMTHLGPLRQARSSKVYDSNLSPHCSSRAHFWIFGMSRTPSRLLHRKVKAVIPRPR